MTLVCAATSAEASAWGEPRGGYEVLTTEVGGVATAVNLLALREPPTCLIQIGIAGAYPDTGLQIGDVVVVRSDRFVDLGMELPQAPGFLPLAQTPFGNGTSGIFKMLVPDALRGLARTADAGTVNTCTGTDATGVLRRDLFHVQVETMEGAAAAFAARRLGCPIMQIRSISNRAGDRSIDSAGIRKALGTLADWLACNRSALDQAVGALAGNRP